ncbi:MAG TPA: hypothetical protein VIK11_06730 [Tepidiformaceae bacterium]
MGGGTFVLTSNLLLMVLAVLLVMAQGWFRRTAEMAVRSREKMIRLAMGS